ncbi:hypothetical protein JKP88DRAFT_268572 [Tribonema minus]|uniref:Uncharacterized protein n=1 Tax=Tribonema minus TaxID=303371 RepID=A0A836CG03_9STRA|nr:hypothetical protein JKP88DRAFT_268572 [Tribonema minus]
MDCKEQESSSTVANACCDNGCSESANVCDSDVRKGLEDVASDGRAEEERSAKHAGLAVDKNGSKKAQTGAVVATGTAAGNDLGSLLPHIEASIMPAAMQKPCLVYRCGKQRIDRFYCLEHRMQSAVKYDVPVDDMDCREQESSSAATNACGDNAVAKMRKTSPLKGVEDKGVDSTYVAAAPTNTYVFSKKTSIMRVEDVNADEIPAMAHIADINAAKQHRADEEQYADEERTAKRVAAAAAKEGSKKARTEPVMAVDTPAGNDQASPLPHSDCNKQEQLSSTGNLCCDEDVSGQVATVEKLSLSTHQDISDSVVAVMCAGTKRCSKCQTEKTLTAFNKQKSNKDGLHYYCKECAALAQRVRVSKRTGFITQLITNSRQRSTKRGMNQNELTAAIFDYICRTQNDRCVYSGIPVTFAPMSDFQASIERLNDDEDYLVENTALCALEFNVRAGWSVAKVKYAATHTDRVEITTVEANVREALIKPTSYRPAGRIFKKEEDRVTLTRCNTCCEWRAQQDFYDYERITCKRCVIDKKKLYGFTWRGAFMNLVHSAKHRCKTGTIEARGLVCEITFEDIVNIYKEQCGTCSYSGIPLTTDGDWKVSLERRDVRVGYSRENCCLIAMEFQGTDYTAVSKYGGDGCGGWSREKYLFFRANYKPADVPVQSLAPPRALSVADTLETIE